MPVGTDPGILAAGQVDGYNGWATNQGVMLQTRGVDIGDRVHERRSACRVMRACCSPPTRRSRRSATCWSAGCAAEIKGWQWHLDNPEEMAVLMVEKYGQQGARPDRADRREPADEGFRAGRGTPLRTASCGSSRTYSRQGIEFMIAAGDMEEGQVAVEDVVTQELIAEAHGKSA